MGNFVVSPEVAESASGKGLVSRLKCWVTGISIEQKVVLGVILTCFLALLVPLFSLGRQLWAIDYYQHFPLLILGGLFLAYNRFRAVPIEFQGVLSIRVVILLLLGIALTVGVFVVPSRWMSSIAAFSLLASTIYFWGGAKLGRLLFGPLLVLAAAIPLPVGFGGVFVVRLQQLATATASLWLDFFNVFHDTTGVSIRTGSNDYLVEQACSGINSVYAAVALGVAYAVLRRYSLVRLVFFLSQLVVWVVIANAVRVFSMVFLKERYGIDIIESLLHEVVGSITFIIGIMLAFSGDHLVRYIFPVQKVSVTEWFQTFDLPVKATWIDNELSRKLGFSLVAVSGCLSLPVLFLFFRYEAPTATQSVALTELVDKCCIDFDAIDQSFMPSELGIWRQAGYERVEVDEDSVFGGMVSFRWRYSHPGGRSAVIQIDGPYEYWHDLTVCYEGAGWAIADETDVTESESEGVAYEILLTKGALEHGHSVFYCVDQASENVVPSKVAPSSGWVSPLLNRLSYIFVEPKGIEGAAIQLQMFDSKPGIINSEDQEANRELFWLAVKALTRQISE